MNERERPDPGSPAEAFREHAEFRARLSPSGIGAAVTTSSFEDGVHVWDCLVTDGMKWHYVKVLGPDLGPYPDIGIEDVEQAIERFAASLPEQDRLHQLRDADPLHIDREGVVRD
jgi:hypothetical protein